MPYISIVIPMYNAENTIERCVYSVVKQNFSDLEIILVDDGSTDKSLHICNNLKNGDSRIIVIHKANGGVSAARNAGIDLATGKYILFVDSDDYLPEDYCGTLLKGEKAYGQNFFCWSALQILSETHNVKEEIISYEDSKISLLERKDVLKLSSKYLLNSPVNKLYSLEIIKHYNIRMNEQINIAEDLLFNLVYLDFMGNCKILIFNHLYYKYVRNGITSLDHGYRSNYFETHRMILTKMKEYCQKWECPKQDTGLFYRRYWEYMQAAIDNNNCVNSPLSCWEKIRENSKILRDKDFQKCINLYRNEMGRASYFMLKSKFYLLIWLYNQITK